MEFPKKYKVLGNSSFSNQEYSFQPIRCEDRYDIMRWRNEQMYHLRQNKPLTIENQDNYFKNIVAKLFDEEQPNQILFSFLKNNKCIGYGGLVHINWVDKNAEVSFIMETELENESFQNNWGHFLDLLEIVAFKELNFHKLFTYAFDIRPQLYKAIEKKGFVKEAVLNEHCLFNGKFLNVIIHSKINSKLQLRRLKINDKDITFKWANDTLTRRNSFSTEEIKYNNHSDWFDRKLNDEGAHYFIGEINNEKIGLVRFDYDVSLVAFIIGITIDENFRGKKLSSLFLEEACKKLLETKNSKIIAYIKETNISSIKAFERAGFKFLNLEPDNNILKFHYEK